jgi:hypothetical protein
MKDEGSYRDAFVEIFQGVPGGGIRKDGCESINFA